MPFICALGEMLLERSFAIMCKYVGKTILTIIVIAVTCIMDC